MQHVLQKSAMPKDIGGHRKSQNC